MIVTRTILDCATELTQLLLNSTPVAESLCAATAMGWIHGRWCGVWLRGVRLEIVGTVLFHVLGFAGVASPHTHALGNGCLLSYACLLGQETGADAYYRNNKGKNNESSHD